MHSNNYSLDQLPAQFSVGATGQINPTYTHPDQFHRIIDPIVIMLDPKNHAFIEELSPDQVDQAIEICNPIAKAEVSPSDKSSISVELGTNITPILGRVTVTQTIKPGGNHVLLFQAEREGEIIDQKMDVASPVLREIATKQNLNLKQYAGQTCQQTLVKKTQIELNGVTLQNFISAAEHTLRLLIEKKSTLSGSFDRRQECYVGE